MQHAGGRCAQVAAAAAGIAGSSLLAVSKGAARQLVAAAGRQLLATAGLLTGGLLTAGLLTGALLTGALLAQVVQLRLLPGSLVVADVGIRQNGDLVQLNRDVALKLVVAQRQHRQLLPVLCVSVCDSACI